LTQSELAARVGLAPNHIVRLESGEKAVPRFDTVARLAAELGLSLDEISWACGYTEVAKLRPKDRTAVAQTANQLAKALEIVRSVDKGLSTAIGSLQRQAGIPKEPAAKRRRSK
jgi:transcriptional regulator with XRE-family HTH domain